ITSTGQTHRETVLGMEVIGLVGRATPTPTSPPAPTATTFVPQANLHVTQNQNFTHSLCSDTAYSVSLLDPGGNAPVGLSFQPIQYNYGSPWAVATPASGTVGLRGSASFQVTLPLWIVCGTTYHATLQLTFPQGGYQPNLALTYTGTT